MDFFLDSCVLIDCVRSGGDDTARSIRPLAAMDHRIKTSITIIGEVVHQCLLKDFDVHGMVEVIRELDLNIIYPSENIGGKCCMMDEMVLYDGPYGSSVTDRTHFAYALASRSDFFITNEGETRGLVAPMVDAHAVRTEAVTLQWVKENILS